MISICKKFEFTAAYRLMYHDGKCHNLHGHTYQLEVEVTGSVCGEGPKFGMIMDFSSLKEIVNEEIIDRLDHTDLNESLPTGVYPTAEAMVEWMSRVLQGRLLHSNINLIRVRLYETPTSYAEWRM